MEPHFQKLIQFSPMRIDHLHEVVAFENDLHEFPWTIGNFRDSLNAGYSGWLCCVAEELAGYGMIMMVLDEAHLLNISIGRHWQRQGLGSELLQFLIDLSKERNCIRMLLEVRDSNQAAQRLYKRFGFSVVGMRKNYYPAHQGREDALIYERVL